MESFHDEGEQNPVMPSMLQHDDLLTPEKFIASTLQQSDTGVTDAAGNFTPLHVEPGIVHVSPIIIDPTTTQALAFRSPPPAHTNVTIQTQARIESGSHMGESQQHVQPLSLSGQFSVNCLTLQLSLLPIVTTAQRCVEQEERGHGDVEHEKIAKDLYRCGQSLYNSGHGLMMRAQKLEELIAQRKGTSTNVPITCSVTASMPSLPIVAATFSASKEQAVFPEWEPQQEAMAQSVIHVDDDPGKDELQVLSVEKPRKRQAASAPVIPAPPPKMTVSPSMAAAVQKHTKIPPASARVIPAPTPKMTVSPFMAAAAKPLPALIPQSNLFSSAGSATSAMAKGSVVSVPPAQSIANPSQGLFAIPTGSAPKAKVIPVVQPSTSQQPLQPTVYKCDKCNAVFTSKGTFKIHVSRHQSSPAPQQPAAFRCQLCPKAFYSEPFLQSHMANAHPPTAMTQYECDQCGMKFTSEAQLDKHIVTHSSKGRHFCPFPGCAKSYKSPYSLKDHMSVHSGQMYPCPYCRKSCISKPALRKHITTEHKTQHASSKADCKKKVP